MDRSTRDKFVSRTTSHITAGNACWETPPAVFAKLNNDFGSFDVDLTADSQRHLCPIWFGPDGALEDALEGGWRDYGKRGYSNPPYGPFVPRILKRAKIEAKQGFISVFLLPLRITKAFREHILIGASQLLFCDHRICFWENGRPRLNKKLLAKGIERPDVALFDSIIVVYAAGWSGQPQVGIWEVPTHVQEVSYA